MNPKTENKHTSAELYCSYVNEFISVDGFANCYGMTRDEALAVIAKGKADHNLHAAAPELLEELSDLEGFVRKFGDSTDRVAFMRAAEGYLVAARKAISRARGES